jgi:hypothetical protein
LGVDIEVATDPAIIVLHGKAVRQDDQTSSFVASEWVLLASAGIAHNGVLSRYPAVVSRPWEYRRHLDKIRQCFCRQDSSSS